MDGSQGEFSFEQPIDPSAVRRFLSDNPEFLKGDEGLLPGLTWVVVGLEGGAAVSQLGGLRLREGRGRRLKAIPETLGEFDALGGAQVREVEQRVGHARNLETAIGCGK